MVWYNMTSKKLSLAFLTPASRVLCMHFSLTVNYFSPSSLLPSPNTQSQTHTHTYTHLCMQIHAPTYTITNINTNTSHVPILSDRLRSNVLTNRCILSNLSQINHSALNVLLRDAHDKRHTVDLLSSNLKWKYWYL